MVDGVGVVVKDNLLLSRTDPSESWLGEESGGNGLLKKKERRGRRATGEREYKGRKSGIGRPAVDGIVPRRRPG
jgi:hypothetical protein